MMKNHATVANGPTARMSPAISSAAEPGATDCQTVRSAAGRLERVCVPPEMPLNLAMARLDAAGLGIILVADGRRHLLGTITDGDVRRTLLAGEDLNVTVGTFVLNKKNPKYPRPICAPATADRETLLRLMQEHCIHHLPLVDAKGKLAGLVVTDDLLPDRPIDIEAIIMAGGMGMRLRPLTEDLPKPMLPVGGRPLLEHTVSRLREAGIRRVNVSTHYKPEKVVDHFKDGAEFGVEVSYVNEDRPMGTAGALCLLDHTPTSPLLVMNGDILTNVDFRAMLAFHNDHEAMLTVGVRKYDFNVPYGVIECEGVVVKNLVEKPTYSSFVNAGIYLVAPETMAYVPKQLAEGCKFNMTDLIERLIEQGKRVVSFPIHEYWLDIGQHDDYARANDDVECGRVS
jgi:dTDP-glucose pyrophosphorylase/CBS domain-containing protein